MPISRPREGDTIKAFALVVSEPAQDLFNEATDWLRFSPPPFGGEEAAARFSQSLDHELPALCQDIAERFASGSNLPRPDEEASLAFGRPAFKHFFTTAASGKRKRGQTSGVWVLFYTLPGANTLRVLGLRHGAAEPLNADFDRREIRE